ncbi:divalent metal cation transporter, partial [Staphylococcus pseudintermedius]|uniref:divalent metal cation transporter n=1 Tax=Staphylococcus pseudintermedius TaxID=283734 RepID=UPI000E3A5FE7
LLAFIILGFLNIAALFSFLLFTVFIFFVLEFYFSDPVRVHVFSVFLSQASVVTQPGALYIAFEIIGATFMPHNLFLHSSFVRSRNYDRQSDDEKREAIR